MRGLRPLLVLLVPAVVLAVAVTGVPAGVTRAAETINVSPNNTKPAEAKNAYVADSVLTVSGTVSQTLNGKRQSYDAFYCYEGCGTSTQQSLLQMGASKYANQGTRELSFWINGQIPTYNGKDHTYEVTLRYGDEGKLSFRVGTTTGASYSGSYSVRIAGPAPPKKTVVDFSVIVKGKPNVAVPGRPPAPADLVSSSIVGSGHVTFVKQSGKTLLSGNESKGELVATDVYQGGKVVRLRFGIVTLTKTLKALLPESALNALYDPATKRLGLLLKVEGSNDPDCPEGNLFNLPPIPPRFAYLVLRPPNVAVLAGLILPRNTTLAGSCKRHARGWQVGSSTQIYLSVRERKS